MEMELLVYASGERQIKHAITKMGIQKGEHDFIAIFLFDKEKRRQIDNIIDNFLQLFHLSKNDSVFNPDDSKLVHFGISKQAIQSVQKDQIFQLVLEKIALVDIIK
jgi:tRNA threonylcarbamoyladenosine modification (KEOPS) complex Cgi121 subunit